MERYVAFLRGMNLGGRRITNEELKRHVAGLGFEDVATFRASGNVVLAADEAEDAVAARLEEGLAAALGYEVPVFLRSREEVQEIVAREPFTAAELAASAGKHQIGLLRRRPSAAARRRVLALSGGDDRLAVEGRELHWLPRGGISESELDFRPIAADLGEMTIRTQGTIAQIAAKHLAA